jgi:hypothetical protein
MLYITIANKYKQHNTTWALLQYKQHNTTWALLQYKQLDVKTHTRTTHKIKNMRITDLTKKTRSDSGAPEG